MRIADETAGVHRGDWVRGDVAAGGGGVRRIGVLMGWSENDPQYRSNLAAFVQGLVRLGWKDGGNLRIEVRWTNANSDRATQLAQETEAGGPLVLLSQLTESVGRI